MRVGAGPAVLLIHGWPGFWYDWRHVIPLLRDHADVVAVDLGGFGASDPAPGDPYAGYDESVLAADVLSLAEHLGLDRFVVAGHDIGSAVAPAMARLAADRVAALALFNPTHSHIGARRLTAAAQRERWHHAFHAHPWSHLVAGRDRETVSIYVGHFLRHWCGRAAALHPEEARAVIEMLARPGALDASFGWYRSRQAHARGEVPPLELPTFVVWGDDDPVSPANWAPGIELDYPQVELEIVPGIGHFVPVEAPAACAHAIRRALAALG